jgi:hypothetical protein
MAKNARPANLDKSNDALKRLEAACDYLTGHWPDKAEADDARVTLAKAAMVRGDWQEALARLNRVNPQSNQHAYAISLVGQVHWQMDRQEKSAHEQNAPREHLELAEKSLRSGLAELEKKAGSEADPEHSNTPEHIQDATLLLAEVLLETNHGAEAAGLLMPRVAQFKSTPQPAADNLEPATLRLFLLAMRACGMSGNVEQAATVTQTLLDISSDSASANALLASFAKMLHDEVKRTRAQIIAAQDQSNVTLEATARNILVRQQEVLDGLLSRIAQRQHLSLEIKVYLGMTAADIGNDDAAQALYKQVIAEADTDQDLAAKYDGQIMRVRAELVGLSRKRGDYAGAVKAIDGLLEAKPGALAYLLEKGRILEAWAAKDNAKLAEAVAHWTSVRQKLAKSKEHRAEYLEAVYSAANCLYLQTRQKPDPALSKQALQLLNSQILVNPTLGGQEELAAKYRSLAKRLAGAGGSTK